ncbi:MAG: hypothetical protein R3A10_09800 [Caldilineaceae bacterium]
MPKRSEHTEIVRRDPYLTEDVRIDYLLAIDDFDLSPEIARKVIELTDAEWTEVTDDAPIVRPGHA